MSERVNSVSANGADLLTKVDEPPKPTWTQPSLFDDEAGVSGTRLHPASDRPSSLSVFLGEDDIRLGNDRIAPPSTIPGDIGTGQANLMFGQWSQENSMSEGSPPPTGGSSPTEAGAPALASRTAAFSYPLLAGVASGLILAAGILGFVAGRSTAPRLPELHEQSGSFPSTREKHGEVFFARPYASPPHLDLSDDKGGDVLNYTMITDTSERSFKWKNFTRVGPTFLSANTTIYAEGTVTWKAVGKLP